MTTEAVRPSPVVFTNKARCRDCYRCVRVCPVKAIRMHEGQASVDESRCIACGTCVRECPQKAKSVRNDLDRVLALLANGVPLAASVAPSFVAAYTDWRRKRLPSALRQLGFRMVAETAVGAYHVAQATAARFRNAPHQPHIGTACPAAVNYIRRYHPDQVSRLVPVVSPMIAHARLLGQSLGPGGKVVFIGPCIAKKAEADHASGDPATPLAAALTFIELDAWLQQAGVDLAHCEDSGFDDEPANDARFFPLAGGSLRAGGLTTDALATNVCSVCGFDDLDEWMTSLATTPSPCIVDPLFCRQGCINGPAMLGSQPVSLRRAALLNYVEERARTPRHTAVQTSRTCPNLGTVFTPAAPPDNRPPSEQRIREVLAMTGKSQPEDQLNCGACGYDSCRAKAIAVIQGMAEPGMCLPHMRRLAERRTDRIIETSPNGIVILDEHLSILSMNPSFRRYFMCSESILGRRISYLMDPDAFQRLASGEQDMIDEVVKHEKYSLVCHQVMYAMREERQYVGIFHNITHSRTSQQKLDELRSRTLMQAEELLQHQVAMAQKIGRFLGESAAQGELLVENLRRLVKDEPADRKEPRSPSWLKDTYTSKS